MSDQLSDVTGMENTESTESHSTEKNLEDCTFSPESHIENTQSFEQSEAIEKELTTLVDSTLAENSWAEQADPAYKFFDTAPESQAEQADPAYKFFDTAPEDQAEQADPAYKFFDTAPEDQAEQADPAYKFFDTAPESQAEQADPAYKFFNTAEEPAVERSPESQTGSAHPESGTSAEGITSNPSAAVLGRAAADPEFRKMLLENTEEALVEYDLSREEKAALSALDEDKLTQAVETFLKSAGRDQSGLQE